MNATRTYTNECQFKLLRSNLVEIAVHYSCQSQSGYKILKFTVSKILLDILLETD